MKGRIKRFLAFVFSFQFSKLLIIFETCIVAYLTRAGVHLAWACIGAGFTSSLPWLASMISCAWAAYGVSAAFYYNKSKAEQVEKIKSTGSEYSSEEAPI